MRRFSAHSNAAFCPRAIPCRTVCTLGGRLGRFTAFFCRDAPPVRRAHISRRAHSRFAELMRASIMPRFLPHPSAAFSDRAAARISSRRFDKRTYQSHIQPHPETCRAVFHRASKRRIFRSNRRFVQPPESRLAVSIIAHPAASRELPRRFHRVQAPTFPSNRRPNLVPPPR